MIRQMTPALVAARALTSVLYGVPPHDLVAMAASPIALTAAAVVACLLPARRALRVEPTEALRAD